MFDEDEADRLISQHATQLATAAGSPLAADADDVDAEDAIERQIRLEIEQEVAAQVTAEQMQSGAAVVATFPPKAKAAPQEDLADVNEREEALARQAAAAAEVQRRAEEALARREQAMHQQAEIERRVKAAEQQRLAEEQAAQAEAQRAAQAEIKRRLKAAEQQRLADEEAANAEAQRKAQAAAQAEEAAAAAEAKRKAQEADIERRANEEIEKRAAAFQLELERKTQLEIERRVAAAQVEAEQRLAKQREQAEIQRQAEEELARREQAALELQAQKQAEERAKAAELQRKADEDTAAAEAKRKAQEAEIERRANEEIEKRAAAFQLELERKTQLEIERRVAAAQAEAEQRLAKQRELAEIERRTEEELARRESAALELQAQKQAEARAKAAEMQRMADEDAAKFDAKRKAQETEIQRRATEEIARRDAERKAQDDAEFEQRMEAEVRRRVAETEKRLSENIKGASQVVLTGMNDLTQKVDGAAAAAAADPRVQDAKKSLTKGLSKMGSMAKQAQDAVEAQAAATASAVTSDPKFKIGKFVAESAVADASAKLAKNPAAQQAAASVAALAASAKRTAAAARDDVEASAAQASDRRIASAKQSLPARAAAAPPRLQDPHSGKATRGRAADDEDEDDDERPNPDGSNDGEQEEGEEDHEEDFEDNDSHFSSVSQSALSNQSQSSGNSASPAVPLRAVVVGNNNGIFAAPSSTALTAFSDKASSQAAIPFEKFEQFAAEETRSGGATQDRRLFATRIDVKAYATKREEGRCIRPAKESVPRNSHLAIQLGFFAAKQAIVEYAGTKPSVVDREAAPTDVNVLGRLSEAAFFFEGELMKDPLVLQNVEGLPYEAESEVLVAPDAATRDARQAVLDATAKWAYGDPLQVWERTRGRRLEVAPQPQTQQTPSQQQQAAAGGTGSGVYTTTAGATSSRFWVGEIDTRKPTATASPFHGGVLYRFSFPDITTQLEVLNGPNLDPLFFNAAIYSVTGTHGNVKISETLQFDHVGKAFFPHKDASAHLQQRSAVTFVPNEHVAGNMYLIVRVLRLAVEDFDDYVDMYVRPDKWKIHHIEPYKQEMQKLAAHSDVLEELGWCYVPINAHGKLLQGSVVIDKLYRAGKPLTDGQIPEYFVNDKKRTSECKVMPVKILVELKDVTANEVSFVPSGGRDGGSDPAIHPENTLSIFDPDARGARPETHRFLNCALPILNAGYFTAYQNLLYLRLHSLKLGALVGAAKIPSTHKTFVLHVCLKANDEDSGCTGDEGAIPAFFAGSLGASALLSGVYSSTIHNEKNVIDIVDEFKIQLPLVLTAGHHLFFTLYACQFKKGTAATKFHRVGCAVMLLLAEKRLNTADPAGVSADAGMVSKYSLSVGLNLEMTLLLAEQAAALGTGYLAKLPTLLPNAFLNNNISIVKFSTACRSTVYAVNSVVSKVFEYMPLCLPTIRRDDRMFRTNGVLTAAQDALNKDEKDAGGAALRHLDASPFDVVSKAALSLPLAEVMAFFPMLVSFFLAAVCSPSASIDLSSRRRALIALTDICHKAQQYDMSVRSAAQKRQAQTTSARGGVATLGPIKTCVSTLLYQYITNDVLFDAGGASAAAGPASPSKVLLFPVYAAIAEVWAAELKAVFGGQVNSSLGQNHITKLSELTWFYLDLILRSLYLDACEPSRKKIPVRERFDASFYEQLRVLVSLLAERMVSYQGVLLVQRLALFVRHLAIVCDRGECLRLAATLVSILDKQQVVYHSLTAVRILLDGDDALQLMWPSAKTAASPQFLLRIVLPPLVAQVVNAARDARMGAIGALHTFLVRTVNAGTVCASQLECLAGAMLQGGVGELVAGWATYRALHEQKPPAAGGATTQTSLIALTQAQSLEERRPLLAVLTWILYTAPAAVTRAWLRDLGAKTAAGLLLMLSDAQTSFRYSGGKDKPDIPVPQAANEILGLWDARYATFQGMLALRLLSDIAVEYTAELRLVHSDKMPVLVFPYFHLIENLLSLQSSTATLQVALTVMYQTVQSMIPELISKKAKMASGVMLLNFRMMTHSCFLVRRLASELFYFTALGYHGLCGSLVRVKSLTAGALVSVAESKARDLQLAGVHVENELESLRLRAEIDASRPATIVSKEYSDRFVDDAVAPTASAASLDDTTTRSNSNASFASAASAATPPAFAASGSGDSGIKYKYTVVPQKLTVERILPIDAILSGPAGLLHRASGSSSGSGSGSGSSFASELRTLTLTMGSLFSDVLRLQVDASMKFNEESGDAFLTVALNFLKQNSVKECLRWLTRLHDFHKKNNSSAEAGMTLALSAGIAFRATEVFYAVKGSATKGARMPYAILTHVFWHDYLRLLPELDDIFPLEAACAVALEWSVVPEEALFTVEGQIKAMKDAAECFDLATYYEFSVTAARVVEQYVRAKRDFKSCAVVFGALQTWSGGILSAKRASSRYFLVWIRMETEVAKKSGLQRKTNKKLQSNADEDDDRDTSQQQQQADEGSPKPTGGSGRLPIKRIVKLADAHMSPDSFKRYVSELAVAILGGPKFQSLLHLTDELTETQPAAAVAAAAPLVASLSMTASGDTAKARKTVSRAPVNRCLVTAHEVFPHFDDDAAATGRRPLPCDKSLPVQKFSSALVIKASAVAAATPIAASSPGSGGATSPPPHASGRRTTAAAAAGDKVNVMSERLHICTHATVRAFPSMTEAIPVAHTAVELLNAYDTAIQYMDKELDALDDAVQPAAQPPAPGGSGDLIHAVFRALTPRRILPPGLYYKEVLRHMHADERIVGRIKELLASVRAKLQRCEAEHAMTKFPELYASVIKGLMDIECTLVECEVPN